MKLFEIDQNKIDFTDQGTWDLICEGDTVGVFQLESRLGRKTAKQAQPRTLEELSDLGAILRPGCAQSKLEDGKNLTYHYVERKAGREPVEYVHPALEPILKSTYGVAVFQEQIIKIGTDLAGMTAAQADLYLRYAVGKKKAQLIEDGKQIFLDGCERNNIPKKDADLIFSWIQAAGRYGFNKCIDPTSVVITPDGEALLDEIQVGDYVLAPKTDDEDHFVEVIDVIDCGPQEVYEIELENGDILRCTLEHEILCLDGEKHSLRNIIENDLDIMVK